PSAHGLFDQFNRLLTRNGVLMEFVPNCGGRQARTLRLAWGPFTNEAHTLSLDAAFFRRNLPMHGFLVQCLSEPYGRLVCNPAPTEVNDDTVGHELLVIVR